MNPQTLLRLCSFTYFDLPELYIRRLARGETVPLSEAARALRRLSDLGALRCGAYLADAPGLFAALETSKLFIRAYENDNAATGFVAYAFEAPGETAPRTFCLPAALQNGFLSFKTDAPG